MTSRILQAVGCVFSLLVTGGCGGMDDPPPGSSQQMLAPVGSNSELIDAAFKTAWYPGERVRVSFTLGNVGTTEWKTTDPSFALASLDRAWGWRYTATTSAVAPGANHAFDFVVTAPEQPGDYAFIARMRALGLGDFGATITRAATVTPGATPQWACEYLESASSVPTQLAPNENRAVQITVRNRGTESWQPGFYLGSEDSPRSLWGQTVARLNQAVPAGSDKTWNFGIRAPAAPGTYHLRREMHDGSEDGVGSFRASNFCVDLAIEVTGSGPLDSNIVSQDFRSPIAPGEPFLATVVLRNSGTQTWSANGDYVLGSLSSPRSLWGETLVPLGTGTAPGESATITLRLAAPLTPGDYEQKWQLRKLSGSDAGYFGAVLSAMVVVDQATTPSYGGTVVDQQIPRRMTAGKSYSAQISLQNTGSTSWTGSSFGLVSTNLPKGLWRTTLSSLAADESVAPGAKHTFAFQMWAPVTAGQYSSSWRMAQSAGVGPFGQVAQVDDIEVTLCGNGALDAAETCDDGNLVEGDGCSALCQAECGDGIVGAAEACDDGNSLAGDGCSACALETGWRCAGEPSVCAEIDECSEETDDCSSDADCSNVVGSFECQCQAGFEGDGRTCLPICGDGIVLDGEECDDGGRVSGDGCSELCTIEPGSTCWGSPSTCSSAVGVVTLAVGYHSCAVNAAGLVKCWGYNFAGALGLGDVQSRGAAPGDMGDALPIVDLGTDSRVRRGIDISSHHACAVLEDGSVKCWGYNIYGGLGLGDTKDRGDNPGEMGDQLPAVDLGTRHTAKSVVVGDSYSCALLDDDSLKCWGGNGFGQLGVEDYFRRGDGPGEMGDSLPTVKLGANHHVKAVSAGYGHNCAVLEDASLKCWGNNYNGQLGLEMSTLLRGGNPGDMGDMLPTINLGSGRSVKSVAAGYGHTCAVLDDDSVKCWGYNTYGQLGIGTKTDRGKNHGDMGDNLPVVDLGTGRTAKAVSVGYGHSCALLDDDSVKCWGSNAGGLLGLGDTADRGDAPGEMGDALPSVPLGTGRRALLIAAGWNHTCALLDDHSVKCWGGNSLGGLGLGDLQSRGDDPGEMGDALPSVSLSL